MARETIDVEKVVEWAYRVQCVDRQIRHRDIEAPVEASSWGAGFGEYVRLGTRVDGASAGPGQYAHCLPDDALIVHDAVLALPDVYLEWQARDVVEVWDARRAADQGMVLIPDKAGMSIAPAYEAVETPPRPLETVSTAVLVILNGRTGSRPEWHPDWRPGSRASDGEPDRREVMHARAIYLAWRLALARLADRLGGALSDFDVTGPDASDAPWKARRPRIVDDIETKLARPAAKRRKRA